MKGKAIILGAGGHGKVLLDAAQEAGELRVLGFADNDPGKSVRTPPGVPVIGNDQYVIETYPANKVVLINGLGSTGDTVPRRRAFEFFRKRGYRFAIVVHPRATLARGVELDEGAQVMAGAIIQTGSRIGKNAIINTGAIVDHDCVVGDHAHIAPGATLSGAVRIGAGAHVGTGASVIQGVKIGAGAIVGAGAVVVRDIRASAVVVGVPARERRE
jgi:sugar O-acyltransferase (sialic acid O-acetyltransferase NeuD family)